MLTWRRPRTSETWRRCGRMSCNRDKARDRSAMLALVELRMPLPPTLAHARPCMDAP
jgi:hypothetical protein